MSRTRAFLTAGLAWVGVVVGHLLAYVVAYPAEQVREGELEATGHGSFEFAIIAAIAIVPAVLVFAATSALSARRRPSVLRTALLLAPLQLVAFALLELLERDGSFTQALAEPAVLLGFAVQVVVALVSSLLLAGFCRAVRALAARDGGTHSFVETPLWRPVDFLVPSRLAFLVSTGRRAPPLPLAA